MVAGPEISVYGIFNSSNFFPLGAFPLEKGQVSGPGSTKGDHAERGEEASLRLAKMASSSTSGQVYAAAVELGIDTENESRFFAIAREMCDEASVPDEWNMYFDENTKRFFYNNKESGESIWQHPNLEYFKCCVFMERQGKLLLQQNEYSRPPTQDEVDAMAEYFDVDLERDHKDVLRVVKMAINAPLPPEWIELDSGGDEVVFQNKKSGEVRDEHPLDPYFRELIRKERKRTEAPGDAAALESPANQAVEADGTTLEDSASAKSQMKRELREQLYGSPLNKIRKEVEKEVKKELEEKGLGIENMRSSLGAKEALASGGQSGRFGAGRGSEEASSARKDSGPAAPQVLPADDEHPEGEGTGVGDSDSGFDNSLSLPKIPQLGKDSELKQLTSKGHSILHSQKEEKIQVVVRARPLEKRAVSAWAVDERNGCITLRDDVRLRHAKHFYGEVQQRQSRDHGGIVQYAFDKVYNDSSVTSGVYNESVRNVVKSALEGINGTIFAYGQTGSGKTFTILGTQDNPGMLMLAINDIFNQISSSTSAFEYTLKVGMLEIYNEELRDLLAPPQNRWHAGERLQIKEDPVLGVKVNGLQEETVKDKRRVRSLISKGLHRRQTGATKLNLESSRSHTIFRMVIESRHKGSSSKKGKGSVRVSTLNFVDLAGSERLAKSGNVGVRAQESTQINLSLMQLGNVISKLSLGRPGDFIPYRNSNLTRILQPSLGGSARCVIVATMSHASLHAEETSHTLRFAARAKTVTNHVLVNEVVSDNALVKQYKREIQVLQQELKNKEEKGREAELVKELEAKVVELEADNVNLSDRLEAMKAKGISDSPPPSPVHLDLPAVANKKHKGPSLPIEKALLSIARAAGVGRSGGGGREQKAEDILYAVRVMRAERDELRRIVKAKDKFKEEIAIRLNQESLLQEERQDMEESCNKLEDLIGGKGQAESLSDRLRLAVDSIVVMSAELATMERHRKELISLTKEHEKAVLQATAKMEKMKKKEKEVDSLVHENVKLKEQLQVALKERNDFAKRLDIDISTLENGGQGRSLPGGAAMNYANTLESHLKKEKEKVKNYEMDIQLYRRRIATILGVRESEESGNQNQVIGGAAIVAARDAQEKLAISEQRVQALEKDRDQLVEHIKKLEGVIPEDFMGDDELQDAEQLKNRLYALSLEVTTLTKERNQLLAFIQALSAKYELPNVTETIQSMQSRTHPQGLKDNRQAQMMNSHYPMGGHNMDQYDVSMQQGGGGGAWQKSKKKKRREWVSPADKQDSLQADIVKLRKRLVEVERARQDAIGRLQAQTRATKMQRQTNEKLVVQANEATAEVQHLKHQLQEMIGMLNYERRTGKMLQQRLKQVEIENEDLRLLVG